MAEHVTPDRRLYNGVLTELRWLRKSRGPFNHRKLQRCPHLAGLFDSEQETGLAWQFIQMVIENGDKDDRNYEAAVATTFSDEPDVTRRLQAVADENYVDQRTVRSWSDAGLEALAVDLVNAAYEAPRRAMQRCDIALVPSPDPECDVDVLFYWVRIATTSDAMVKRWNGGRWSSFEDAPWQLKCHWEARDEHTYHWGCAVPVPRQPSGLWTSIHFVGLSVRDADVVAGVHHVGETVYVVSAGSNQVTVQVKDVESREADLPRLQQLVQNFGDANKQNLSTL